jgi:hypothetical protein
MKLPNFRLIRDGALAATLSFPLFAAASTRSEPAARDRAAELLTQRGTVSAVAAGRHVEPGTFRVQVAAKLGRPDAVLADGTWLYHSRKIEGSTATGTLVVRFTAGRVVSLALASPATVAALRDQQPRAGAAQEFVARK